VNPVSETIATARTFLIVPGDRPDRFGKAVASEADIVVLDLEDAVSSQRKPEAREHVSSWLGQRNQSVVRINAAGTPWHAEDVAMIADHAGTVIAVIVPKAEDPGQLEALSLNMPAHAGVIPLIETAAGVVRAPAICATTRVMRPLFGSLDLAAQLRVNPQVHGALRHARSALVLAAAASGCAAPIDGVTTSFADDSRLRTDLEHAVALGFTGKLCIHPRQVAIANQHLSPSDADVGWARGVIAAAQDSSVTVYDGQMIDSPVVLRARSILSRAHLSEGRLGTDIVVCAIQRKGAVAAEVLAMA
jgi:citrate lyase subunit beta/citryl-CoA lyase